MFQRIAIAVGAGLASALLFVVPATRAPIAMALAFVGPLPIMIAGLGFGPAVGLSAAFAGSFIIALSLHPLLGLFFGATLGLPAYWLSRLAIQSRPLLLPDGTHHPTQREFYPQGRLLAWMATLSGGTALLLVLVMAARDGSLSTTIDGVAESMAPLIVRLFNGENNLPGGYSAQEFARAIVLSMPAVMAGWGVITLAVNLWLAARVAQISGLIPLVASDIPYRLRLPADSIWILVASLVACLLGETSRLIGSTIAAAFAVAFALHGLAAIHGAMRGHAARTPLLVGVYFTMFVLLPWPLIIASIVGIFDTFVPFRRKPAPPRPASPT